MYLNIIVDNEEKGIVRRNVEVEKMQGVYFVDEDNFNGKIELSRFLFGITGAGAEIEWIALVDDEGDLLHVKNYPESLRNLLERFLSCQGLI
jgi:hypothetical protein